MDLSLSTEELFILSIGALGFGMYLLFKGGDWTIDSAVFIAKRFGISPLLIGFTIVAFGTSLPELIVSVNANLSGLPGIALGNVIGSNIANILLVIGVTAFFSTLIAIPREIMRDMIMMLVASVLMVSLMLYGSITFLSGALMISVLIAYVVYQYVMASKGKIKVEDVEAPVYKSFFHGLIFLIFGLAAISIGAEFLVRGAKISATIIGVPEAVIGLSIIAIGTSLPELSTCVIAAIKKQSDIVIGNIIGSNVFNILMIIGATALIKPIAKESIDPEILNLDIWVMLGVAIMFSFILLTYKKITRPIGFVFVFGYVLYIALIYGLYLSKDITAIAG